MRMQWLAILGLVALFVGCDRSAKSNSPASAASRRPPPREAHQEGEGHEDDAAHSVEAAPVIGLGTTKVGDLTVRASRDKGEIKPGGDAPIDAWITTSDAKPATLSAVRFWIGSEDARGSIKAKAEIEDPRQPQHWHTHVEVPEPLPVGSRLWIAMENQRGETFVCSFDIKQ